MANHKNRKLLRLIAIFKLVKSLFLIAAGVSAFTMSAPDTASRFREWAEHVTFVTEHSWAQQLLSKVTGLDSRKIEALGLVAFVYGVLFIVEGLGLWLGRRWAEYLTIVATGSLIPFELYEIVKKQSAGRITTLVINTAVVVYLIFRVMRDRKERHA